ncbi:endomucin isoform X1 [Grus americana]|uniref:endomucin isoform X1 n=1 Tax=Grus americana TaxID=9117 RepID=UPI002407981F|nr:endomucin isoform X1 [Grus americana]
MKLLGIAFFFLAVLCVCTVGEGNTPGTVRTSASASTLKSVTEAVKASISQATTLQTSVLTTAVSSTNESIPSNSTPSSPNTTQQITQGAATQPPVKVTTTAADKSGSTTNTTQESGTQLAQNGSSGAPSTEGCFFSSTTSLHNTTSAPGTSSFHVSSLTKSTNLASDGPRSSPGNKNASESTIHYSSVILPIVITLIVITLSVFSLVALYRMCQKKTPEGQENGTEQAQSDKEGVKLLSVKTTSPETGEHSSQGKNKTRQLFTPQQ